MSVSQEMFQRQYCIINILSCVKSPNKICLGDFVCIYLHVQRSASVSNARCDHQIFLCRKNAFCLKVHSIFAYSVIVWELVRAKKSFS